MLNAAMIDPVAAQAVRTGRVLSAFTSTGVSELDVSSVIALPDALDVQAVPVDGPAEEDEERGGDDESVGLHVVPDDGAKLAAAEDEVEETAGHLAAAEKDLAEVESSMESLNARRLQLQGEADELRRKLATIEDDVDQVDDELEETEEARETAQSILEEAKRSHTKAEQALERLRSRA
jgi:hypothetical protein